MRSLLPTILILMLVGSCGSDEDESDAAPSFDGFDAELASAQCEKILRCCTAEELDQVFSGVDVDDQADCVTAVQGYTRAFLVPSIEESNADGAVSVDPDRRTECLDALRGQACGSFTPSPTFDLFAVEACRAFVDAELETSEFCSENFECKTGFCSRPPGAEQGSCKTPPALAEPCLSDRCADGLFCSRVDDLCRQRLAVGEPCDRNEQCQSNNCLERADATRTCGPEPVACQEGS